MAVLLILIVAWLGGRGRGLLLVGDCPGGGLVRVLQGEVPPSLPAARPCHIMLLNLSLLGIICRYLILGDTSMNNLSNICGHLLLL